jgi:two-component system chemotaxis response regulator CheB
VTTGDPIEIGRVAIAPADGHLVVRGERLAITHDPPVEGHRPSASVLLSSATGLGSRLLAVVLSGMGRDGAAAVPELLARGGSCMVQMPAECAVGSMPRAALEKSPRVRSVPTKDLGIHVARWIERHNRA